MVTLSDWICIFPSAQAPYVYAFDDLSRADLERHRRRTVTMANLLNEGFEVSDVYDYRLGCLSHEHGMVVGFVFGQ